MCVSLSRTPPSFSSATTWHYGGTWEVVTQETSRWHLRTRIHTPRPSTQLEGGIGAGEALVMVVASTRQENKASHTSKIGRRMEWGHIL